MKKAGKILMNIQTRANQDFKNFVDLTAIKSIKTKVKGKFFLINYKYDENLEAAFLNFLLENVQNYALTRKEIEECKDVALRIVTKAFKRFVKKPKSGELGEIILFHLLEVFENAVQVVNKMSLKTSGNMHCHGADAVHFGIDDDLKILYLGESKTGKRFAEVLSKSLNSVEEFYTSEKYQFEIDLASGNLSPDIPDDLKPIIKSYLDPTQRNKGDFTEVHAIFLGFEESFLKELEIYYSGKELVKQIIERYKEKIEEYIKKVEEKLDSYKDLLNKRFYFYFLPFKDFDKLDSIFSQKVKMFSGENHYAS